MGSTKNMDFAKCTSEPSPSILSSTGNVSPGEYGGLSPGMLPPLCRPSHPRRLVEVPKRGPESSCQSSRLCLAPPQPQQSFPAQHLVHVGRYEKRVVAQVCRFCPFFDARHPCVCLAPLCVPLFVPGGVVPNTVIGVFQKYDPRRSGLTNQSSVSEEWWRRQ